MSEQEIRNAALTDIEINRIQKFIKINYLIMYEKWTQYSKEGYYEGK